MIKNKIKNALKSIENYLFNNQEYGFWIDFTACHGGSTCWTTSYVGRHLAENPKNLERLSFIKDRIKFNQRMDGGWGYNHTAASDADTTANCILFLLKFPDTKEAIEAGIEHLLKQHDQKTGGILTYTENDFGQYTKEYGGRGWYSPTVEITALATRALIESGYNGCEIQKSLEFIASKQDSDGSWQPYWWGSREYTMVESIETLKKFSEYKENIKLALEYLTDKRRKFGWVNDFTEKYSPFYAAISLGVLLRNDLVEKYGLAERYQINKKFVPRLLEGEISILIDKQNTDGSFGPEPLFRIPRPDIIDASEIKNWTVEIPHKNSIYTDNNRFFTTATVYSTLLKYLEY